MTTKKDEAAKADDKQQAAATASVAGPTHDEVKAMIADAMKTQAEANEAAYKEFVSKMPDTILGVVKDTKLFDDRIHDEVSDAVDKLDLTDDIIKALDARDKAAAEEAEAAAKAEADAATAAQRKVVAEQKKAARAVEDAEMAAIKKRAAAADRAKREYVAIVGDPVPSMLAIADANSIELRFADGATFMPGFEIGGIAPDALADEGGRPVLNSTIAVPREAVGFSASEAILIVEGGDAGDPLALYRAELFPPVRVGGGKLVDFPAGSFAFRRLSPVPEAAA